MAGMYTGNMELLTRQEIWSDMLKETLLDQSLMGQKYVDWIDFPDGETLTIPSFGELDAYDYTENTPVQYQALDTGEFQFSITEYKGSGTYITKKARQDSKYAARIEAQFVPMETRAIMKQLERDIFKEGQPRTGNPAGYQTAGGDNAINGYRHRWVGSDTVNSQRVLSVEDFALAGLSLRQANVPETNLVAVVPPAQATVLETHPNFINFSNNHQWEGVVKTGLVTGMRFVKNIYGFDVYTSNYLPYCGADQSGASETIDSVASGANAKTALFFSATAGLMPYIGAWRQMPEVDAEYNKDYQREEYVTTARYGVKIQRPENLVSVLVGDPYKV